MAAEGFMDQGLLDFQKKFDIEENVIYRSDYWTWSLRPIQCTLGAGILSLNRFETSFGGITESEGKDLAKIVCIIENTLSKAFGYDKMNYLMLMMVDLQVHYHVIPRYSHSVSFEGKEFTDIWWPKPPRLEEFSEKSSELASIRKEILKIMPTTM